jgi:hypothetical protein
MIIGAAITKIAVMMPTVSVFVRFFSRDERRGRLDRLN